MKHLSVLEVILLLIAVSITGCSSNEEISSNIISLPVDTLRIITQIGVDTGDSTNTFAAIADALIDRCGRVFVLDEVEACIKVYDLDGNYIRQVSRRGEGPGELRDPFSIFLMPDGRIGAIESRSYHIFDDSLRFVEELNIWAENPPYHVSPISNSRLAACRYDDYARGDIDVLSRTVAIYHWGEEDPDTVLWKDSVETTFTDAINNFSMLIDYALFKRISTCTDGNGSIYFAPMDPDIYEITGWDSTGREIMHVSRDMTPVEKSQEDIQSETFYANSYLQRSSTGPVPFEYEPQPYKIMIDELGIGPDGNLWVRLGLRNEPFFDIYDLHGNLLHHAVLPVEGWSWETEVTPRGILAWEEDPESGYQVLYLIE